MRLQMYAIYDTIADIFHKPFCAHNDSDAIRSFVGTFDQNQGAQANKEDYVLYHLAEYNDQNGEIYPGKKDSHAAPLKIYTGFDIGKEQAEETVKVVK
jgi:hypothetical protein